MAKSAWSIDGHSNTGRHVAIETPSDQEDHQHLHHRPHRSGLSDVTVDVTVDYMDKDMDRCRPYCFRFFLWACIGLFILTIILLISGGIYMGILKSDKPYANVMKLNITNLQVNDDNNIQKADISLDVRLSNKDDKIKLLYGPITIDVTSKDDVQLGRTKIGSFSQNPKNDTDLSVAMTLENIDGVNNNKNSGELMSEMVLDVYLSGKIGLKVGAMKVTPIPILISCQQIKQVDLDNGTWPECEVKLFALRPKLNPSSLEQD